MDMLAVCVTHVVCILSASEAISNVTLGQSATSGETVTCEVQYFNCLNLAVLRITRSYVE
jgi:hypothetical protein